MPKILISDKMSPLAAEIFAGRGVDCDVKTDLTPEELQAIIGDYDGLAVRSATKATAEIIAGANNLKVIGRAGIGVDNIDVKAATAKGVVVMNTPFGNTITTAEHAIAMLFAAARQIPAANAGTQAGEWPKKDFMGTELTAKTLGVIGCGNIGAIVAERAIGLKMKVIAYDPFLTEERATDLGVTKVSLEDLLKRADAITLHTPLTDQTRNILSADALKKTKKGVIIVNCARGGLVDEAAVREGLDSGHISAAAFDVFIDEPAKDNVLFGAPNFVATPHLGAATSEAQENVALQVAEQISDYLLTGAISNALNTPSITAEEAPRLKPYADLAEKLGLFAGQIADGGFTDIEIGFEGEPAHLNTKPLTAAAVAGAPRPIMTDVNMVSAPEILKANGVTLTEATRSDSPVYDNLIRIRVKVNGNWRDVAGAIVGGIPKIVEVKGMALDAKFRPHILYVNNLDKPGFIGSLGTLLGEAGINIAAFNLGRESEGKEAVALVGIDADVPEDTLKKIQDLTQVRYVKVLDF